VVSGSIDKLKVCLGFCGFEGEGSAGYWSRERNQVIVVRTQCCPRSVWERIMHGKRRAGREKGQDMKGPGWNVITLVVLAPGATQTFPN
jgi:hypothetical protein